MAASPPLSVVMPVRNAGRFLDEAVASIVSQTWSDFEFVILDDSSSDGSGGRLQEWAARDARIRVVSSDVRLGPVGSSQAAVEHSRAPLVARMDADDVAHPERLEREIELFRRVPDAALIGTLHRVIDAEGRTLRGLERWPLASPRPMPPMVHASIMMRREAFDRCGGYRAGTEYWEDIDLFTRLAGEGRVLVIPQALVDHRQSSAGTRCKADPAELDAAYARMAARASAGGTEARGGTDPGALLLSGSPLLWAGRRPGVLRRLLRPGNWRWSVAHARVLLWALWAEASPASLRSALRTAARLREMRVPRRISDAEWVEWRPQA